jgi:hypothetical protein
MASRHQHASLQFFLAEIMGRIDDGSFIIVQLCVKQKGVLPLKRRLHDLNPSNIKDPAFYRDAKCSMALFHH